MKRRAGSRRLLRLLPLLALAGPLAAAATPPSAVADYLSRMDRDGDGRVSLAEYLEWMSYGFDAMDRNGDGVLQAAEQPGGRGQPISRAEHRARLAERFRRQDVDGDGHLSARELAAPPR